MINQQVVDFFSTVEGIMKTTSESIKASLLFSSLGVTDGLNVWRKHRDTQLPNSLDQWTGGRSYYCENYFWKH